MLDPVSTRTIFSWLQTTAGSASSPPRVNARNLHEFVRTQSSLSSGNSVQIPRAANEHLSRVFPKSSGGSRQCDSGRKYSCAESGTKRLTRIQLRSILSRSKALTQFRRGAPFRMRTILLLTISNIFMTFAWYGHLKFRSEALWKVIVASWGIAFFEYCFQVPANRIGSYEFNTAQLKTIQEVITLTVFALFSVSYLGEKLKWNYGVGAACLVLGFFCFPQMVMLGVSVHRLWRPCNHFLQFRKMKRRRRPLRLNPQIFCHRIHIERCLRLLQLPRRVMNLSTQQFAVRPLRVQAIPFRQKILQRSTLCFEPRTFAAVTCLQLFASAAPIVASREIFNSLRLCSRIHSRVEIRKMEPKSCDLNCQDTRCVQTKKPYARLALRGNVGAHIQFRKCRKPRDRRRSTQPHSRHRARHNADPRLSVKRIQFEFRRNQPANSVRRHRPMHKQQVMPFLRHYPWARRQSPRPVRKKS